MLVGRQDARHQHYMEKQQCHYRNTTRHAPTINLLHQGSENEKVGISDSPDKGKRILMCLDFEEPP